MDLLKCHRVVDVIAISPLNDHGQDVGRAKHLSKFFVQLDIRMAGGIKSKKIRFHGQPGVNAPAENGRNNQNHGR